MKKNKYGCKRSQDVCLVHDSPLVCIHGCSDAIKHGCEVAVEEYEPNSFDIRVAGCQSTNKIDYANSYCEQCDGKGYGTSYQRITGRNYEDKREFAVKICKCERGGQIRKYFNIKPKHKPIY